jgi:hypothetical protein
MVRTIISVGVVLVALVCFTIQTQAVGLPADPALRSSSVVVPGASFETVGGTVTVRLNGVLTDPQRITYQFSPDFPVSYGPLEKSADGTYFLRACNVPMTQAYTLTISATYDSTVRNADGIVTEQGRVYSGLLKLDLPYSSEFDFGVQFLDLQ